MCSFRHDRTGVPPIRSDDTQVTLSVDPELKLEERIDLLSYAFAKTVQGATLKKICKWDVANGCVQFIVSGGPYIPGPRGRISALLEDAGIEHATHPVAATPD